MGFLTAPEDALIEAVAAGQTQLRLNHCFGSLDAVFKNALQKEPRLLAFLAGYSSTYQKKGLVQLCFDYDVTLRYQEPRPASLGEVAVDTGVWDPAPLLRRGLPREETLVTQDPADVSRKLSALLGRLLSEYEGIHGWRTGVSSFGKLSPYAVCTVSYDYLLPLPQLRQLQGKARFAAKQIWRSILGRAAVPRFVKPFLALSYLSQECGYDQRAFDEAAGASDAEPSDLRQRSAEGRAGDGPSVEPRAAGRPALPRRPDLGHPGGGRLRRRPPAAGQHDARDASLERGRLSRRPWDAFRLRPHRVVSRGERKRIPRRRRGRKNIFPRQDSGISPLSAFPRRGSPWGKGGVRRNA